MVDPKLNIIFMGTPEFAVYGLRSMLEAGYEPRLVVTQPDRPKGRGRLLSPPPVKEFCYRKNLKVLQPEDPNAQGFVKNLKEVDPDLIVVIAYGHILKKDLLKLPKMGCLNIHASLLPALRGPAPIQWAIIEGLRETGLTAIWMDEGVDTGNIILQERVEISTNETCGTLHEKLGKLSGPFLVRVLRYLQQRGYDPGIPQDNSLATFAPKLTKQMRKIDWEKPAEFLSRVIRALDPFPGAYAHFKGQEIRLFKASEKKLGMESKPGKVVMAKGSNLIIGTGKGHICVGEAQLSGKKRLPISEFLKGFRIQEGEFFE